MKKKHLLPKLLACALAVGCAFSGTVLPTVTSLGTVTVQAAATASELQQQISALYQSGDYKMLTLRSGVTISEVNALKANAAGVQLDAQSAYLLERAYDILTGAKIYDKSREFVPTQYGDTFEYAQKKLMNCAGSNRQHTGIWVTPGKQLHVYVTADENDPLPSIIITQHVGIFANETVKTLKRGLNVLDIDYSLYNTTSSYWVSDTEPGGTIYIGNKYTPDQQSSNVKVYIDDGDQIPVFKRGEDSEKFREQLKDYYNHYMAGEEGYHDAVELVSEHAVMTMVLKKLYKLYVLDYNDPNDSLASWEGLVEDMIHFDGITDEEFKHQFVNVKINQPYAGAYATLNMVGVQDNTWVDSLLGGNFGWGYPHEFGHVLDWYYPRKYTEVTNNVWSVNYMAQHDIRTQTAILRQTQQISNDDEVTDWTWNNVSKYYFHTYMFWDLECYHHGYWAELDTMYRKGTTGNAAADAALKNISDEYEKLAAMSSLITGLDLTYYFQRWDYVKATPSAAYTSAIASLNLKKEQPKLWYSDWDSYNDSTSTAVGKANKVNVENITTVGTTNYISCSTHYNVRNEHMGYEVAREGKVVGFTYDQIFEDKGIDPSKDYTYTVTAYDRAHAPYATATVNKSSCTNTAAAKIGTTTYQSLEDAIAAASSGDKIILMRSVVMFKGVNLDGKKLKISAGDTSRQYYIMDRSGTVDLFKLSNGAELQFSGLGKDNIVICGTSKGGTKSAFSLSGGSSLNFSYTKVKDFKGSSGGSLVYLANSNLTLSGAVLTNNEVSGSSMIYIGGSSTMDVKNDSVLQYNSANSNGVPVYVDGTNAAVNLTNCLIYRNDASGDHKGGIFYVEKGALNAAYGTRFMGNLSLGFCNCAAATICENGHLTLSNNAYIGDSVMISGPVNIGSGFTGEATLFVPSGLNKEGFVAAVGTGKQTLDPSVLSRLNYQTEQYKLVCADGKVVLAKGSDKVYGRVDVRYVDASTGEEIVLRDKKYYNVGESYAVAAKKISGYTYDGQKPSNASGKTSKTPVTVTYRYNKAGSQTSDSSKLKIHYYNANNWSKVGCYVYSESGSSTKEYTGKWPGKVMNADTESGWFYLEVDAANAKVIFNNNQASNGSQEPSGVGTPGYDVSGEVFIKNQKISRAGTVKVRYAADTGELLAGETIHGSADGTSTYTTTAKTIEGYTLKTTPTNAKGTITAGETTVTYVYTKAPVKVEYVALDKTSVSVNAGEKATLKSTVIPSNADNPRLGYSSANTAVATVTSAGVITGVSSGTTTVTAKSADGAVSKVTVTVKGEVPLTNQGTISEVKVPKCTWVTLKGAATGGKSGYKYAFYYKKITSSAWTSVGEIYGNQTQVMFGPAAVGTYKVKINVKDAAGTVVSKIFTLTSTAPTTEDLQNKSTLSAKSIVKDKPITITGKATGGSGSYTYAFYYKKTTSKAFTAIGTEYGTSTKAVFTPASKAAYNVRVNVKDSTGRIVTLQYMLPVAEETSSTLVNNSTISASEVKKGTKVTLTAKASGGSGSYRYAFYYKKSTSNNWTVIGTEYDTNATASFTPAMAAVYNVKINVMDSTGAMLEKTFAVISNN